MAFYTANPIYGPSSSHAPKPEPAKPTITPSTADGDIFVLLGVEDGTIVTCDFATRRFHAPADAHSRVSGLVAFCNLPPGPHFVWVSVPRVPWQQGYWFFTGSQRPGRTHVKRWSANLASLVDCSNADAQIYAVPNPPIVAFGYEEGQADFEPWPAMTSCISERLLQRLTRSIRTPSTNNSYWLIANLNSGHTASASALPWLPPQHILGPVSFGFRLRSSDVQLATISAQETRNSSSHPCQSAATEWILDVLKEAKDERRAVSKDRTMTDAANEAANEAADALDEIDLVGELQFAYLLGSQMKNGVCLHQWHTAVCQAYMRAPNLAVVRPRLCRLVIETLQSQIGFIRKEMESENVRSMFGDLAPIEHQPTFWSPMFNHWFLCPSRHERGLYHALEKFMLGLEAIMAGLGPQASAEQREVADAFTKLKLKACSYRWNQCANLSPANSMSPSPNDVELPFPELMHQEVFGFA